MDFTDVVIVYVVLAIGFIVAALIRGLWLVARAIFCAEEQARTDLIRAGQKSGISQS